MVPNNPTGGDPFSHWLDDAAYMGLMLFRMRNDSKRERALHRPPPVPAPAHQPTSLYPPQATHHYNQQPLD